MKMKMRCKCQQLKKTWRFVFNRSIRAPAMGRLIQLTSRLALQERLISCMQEALQSHKVWRALYTPTDKAKVRLILWAQPTSKIHSRTRNRP